MNTQGNLNIVGLSNRKAPSAITLAELLDMALPERKDLISPWLREGESAMLYAEPGVGKSFVALDLALAIAGGGCAMGMWNAPEPRRVLYVDGEMPLDDIRERMNLLIPSIGSYNQVIMKNLLLMARHKQAPAVEFTDLAREESRERLIQYALANQVDLIILDNLSTLATIDDENSASAFNAPVKFLLRLKQHGLACILVHHSGKNGGNYRGSSKLATTFEYIIKLEKKDNLLGPITTTNFKLHWEKHRRARTETYGTPLDISMATSPFGEDGAKQIVWTYEVAEDMRVEKVLGALESGQYGTQAEMAQALGMTPVMVSRLKDKAIAQGLITENDWKRMLGAGKRDVAEAGTCSLAPDF